MSVLPLATGRNHARVPAVQTTHVVLKTQLESMSQVPVLLLQQTVPRLRAALLSSTVLVDQPQAARPPQAKRVVLKQL